MFHDGFGRIVLDPELGPGIEGRQVAGTSRGKLINHDGRNTLRLQQVLILKTIMRFSWVKTFFIDAGIHESTRKQP